ncbi:Tfp pilus assembly protein PilN [Desulfonispora thiosulfatigenes DSM 11270]|uniref:Tfp pilus assembly protein PilN n=1 Tax=Desulfonispora thiosulfatigenes DSM 11270 TaxID=656914 RepID=A0A1W1VP94_DESTI|nr:PilN domain-containing protein [Desulfonispora thiosulfatigenes]SMB94744.1 Tfp pilus assembly protein PilN [Desulfonispora thiosulfatigenes DSM 11270]
MDINLLPPKYKSKLSLSKKGIKRILIYLSIFSIIIIGITSYNSYKTALLKKEAILQKKLANLEPGYKSITEYEEKLANNNKVKQITEHINTNKQVWSSLLVDISGCLENGSWLKSLDKKDNKLIIQGNAENFNLISTYAIKLRELTWFKNVDITLAEAFSDPNVSTSNGNKQQEDNKQNFFALKDNKIKLNDNLVTFTIEAELKRQLSFSDSLEGGSK